MEIWFMWTKSKEDFHSFTSKYDTKNFGGEKINNDVSSSFKEDLGNIFLYNPSKRSQEEIDLYAQQQCSGYVLFTLPFKAFRN